jgi:hypothetical protein
MPSPSERRFNVFMFGATVHGPGLRYRRVGTPGEPGSAVRTGELHSAEPVAPGQHDRGGVAHDEHCDADAVVPQSAEPPSSESRADHAGEQEREQAGTAQSSPIGEYHRHRG